MLNVLCYLCLHFLFVLVLETYIYILLVLLLTFFTFSMNILMSHVTLVVDLVLQFFIFLCFEKFPGYIYQ